jgi:hypothetical protein
MIVAKKPARMKPIKAWALVFDDGHLMVAGDYDRGQLTVYRKRPATDRIDLRIVRVEIRELPPKRKPAGGK